MAPPNIIVIVADDLTPAYLGCYGGKTPTPHLDRLAARGVRCTRAHCVAPLCNPSRYTLLTGQYPGRNAAACDRTPPDQPYHLGQTTVLVAGDPCIARTLKAAGYLTGYVGKWHSNFELGAPLEWKAEFNPDDPATDTALRTGHVLHVAAIKRLTGFDYVASLQVGNLDKKAGLAPKAGCHNPEWQTQGALDFITQSAGDGKPFFLHLANSVPHSPDILTALKQDPRYTQGGKLAKAPACHPPRSTVVARLAKAGLNTTGPLASINAGTVMLDDQLGAVTKKLTELGIMDNTMIIWLADHAIYGKGTVYTPGTHAPMIMAWPKGLPAGTTLDTPVSFVDLYRTCVAAAGATMPKAAIDGVNLLPLLRGGGSRAPVYMEMNWLRGLLLGNFHFVAFRPAQPVLAKMQSGAIKFAVDTPAEPYRDLFGDLNAPFKPAYFDADQLYDLAIDPFERNNLAYHPAYADKVKEMKAALAPILATFARPFPLDVPPFMLTKQYADLVAERMKLAAQRPHYPEFYDAEHIYNLNLKDPRAS